MIFAIGVTLYILIRLSKVLFELSSQEADAWQHEHKFQIAWFLTFCSSLATSDVEELGWLLCLLLADLMLLYDGGCVVSELPYEFVALIDNRLVVKPNV